MKTIDLLSFFLDSFGKYFESNPSLSSMIFLYDYFSYNSILCEKSNGIVEYRKKIIVNIIKSGKLNGEVRTEVQDDDIANLIIGYGRLIVKEWDTNNNETLSKKLENKLIPILKLLIVNIVSTDCVN
jgi:hypothetical protein